MEVHKKNQFLTRIKLILELNVTRHQREQVIMSLNMMCHRL